MIKKQKFEIENGELSFDPKTKWIKIKIGKESSRIKKKDLWQIAFMISDVMKQDELLPAQQITMMEFDREHMVKAEKDIKAGEIVKFHCHVSVPKVIVDHLLEKKK